MERKTHRVLVVGDWLVDDHWVVAEARSPTASRIGKTLFRSLQGSGNATSLCGAGRTASILAGASWGDEKNGPHPFEVVGLGAWHLRDKDYMHTLLSAYRENEWDFTSVYQRSPHKTQPADGLSLFNLASLLSKEDGLQVGTTTAVRIYHRSEHDTVLRERIDFESQARATELGSSPLSAKLSPEAMAALGEFCHGQIDAVVVKDLGKGVVTPYLVEWLAKNTANARWFVSSKSWIPDWLPLLPKGGLRLLMIPEMASRDAVRKDRILAWTTPSGSLTRDALEQLKVMHLRPAESEDRGGVQLGDLWAEDSALVVSFDDLNVHMRTNGGGDDLISARIDESARHELTTGFPFSSVLQPALVACALQQGVTWHTALDRALRFTSLWRRKEAERIHNPVEWDSKEVRFNVHATYADADGVRIDAPRSSDEELRQWNNAMTGVGVVSTQRTVRGVVHTQPELQLWRAMSDLDGYVCCAPQRRTAIHRLLRGIREFLHGGAKYHSGCVLVAPPGSGKSFLIKCIARRAGIRMLEPFNITQLTRDADIHRQIFDKIHEEQQRLVETPLLVFVDEINAGSDKHAGAHDAFLEPLQDGTYVSDRRRLRLEPCYWVFVSTKIPPAGTESKWSDFQSRLPDGVVSLAGSRGDQEIRVAHNSMEAQESARALDVQKLENVYLAVRTVRSVNPWVTHVMSSALDALLCLRVVPADGRGGKAIDNRTLIAHFRTVHVSGDLLRREHLDEKWLSQWSDDAQPQKQRDQRVRVRAVPQEVP